MCKVIITNGKITYGGDSTSQIKEFSDLRSKVKGFQSYLYTLLQKMRSQSVHYKV